jgi:hypothetical protein
VLADPRLSKLFAGWPPAEDKIRMRPAHWGHRRPAKSHGSATRNTGALGGVALARSAVAAERRPPGRAVMRPGGVSSPTAGVRCCPAPWAGERPERGGCPEWGRRESRRCEATARTHTRRGSLDMRLRSGWGLLGARLTNSTVKILLGAEAVFSLSLEVVT